MKLTVHTDGGARGNPGPAGIGVVVERDGKEIAAFGKTIGETTNNVAEYTAVVQALTWIQGHREEWGSEQLNVDFYLDSTLVVNQLNGLFKVKDARLREFLSSVRLLEQNIGGDIRYTYVPREHNSRADYFVNHALDGYR